MRIESSCSITAVSFSSRRDVSVELPFVLMHPKPIDVPTSRPASGTCRTSTLITQHLFISTQLASYAYSYTKSALDDGMLVYDYTVTQIHRITLTYVTQQVRLKTPELHTGR